MDLVRDIPGTDSGNGIGRRARRVLVVEDDSIVAMVLVTGLEIDGWHVIGPAATVAQACRLLAGEGPPDVALLDINLDGAPVYPLAEILQARDIPFVFCSGYSTPVPDSRFAHVPLIVKPARAHHIDAELRRLVEESILVTPGS